MKVQGVFALIRTFLLRIEHRYRQRFHLTQPSSGSSRCSRCRPAMLSTDNACQCIILLRLIPSSQQVAYPDTTKRCLPGGVSQHREIWLLALVNHFLKLLFSTDNIWPLEGSTEPLMSPCFRTHQPGLILQSSNVAALAEILASITSAKSHRPQCNDMPPGSVSVQPMHPDRIFRGVAVCQQMAPVMAG